MTLVKKITVSIMALGTLGLSGSPFLWADESAPPKMPTADQINKAMSEGRLQTDKAIQQMNSGNPSSAVVASPRFEAIETKPGGIDIEEIMSNREKVLNPKEAPEHRLLVFVSLSMPKESLRRALADAERAQSAVVMRGLVDGSFKKTLETMQTVMEGRKQSNFQIDPVKFKLFDVQQVPTTVLIVGDIDRAPNKELSPPKHYAVAGDVSLDYALDAIVRSRPDAEATAAPFIDRLEVRP